MTDPIVFAADRLNTVEDQQSEHVAWLKDMTDDLVFVASMLNHQLEALECLQHILRPVIVPATEQHRQLAQMVRRVQQSRSLLDQRLQGALTPGPTEPPHEPGQPSPPTPEKSPD